MKALEAVANPTGWLYGREGEEGRVAGEIKQPPTSEEPAYSVRFDHTWGFIIIILLLSFKPWPTCPPHAAFTSYKRPDGTFVLSLGWCLVVVGAGGWCVADANSTDSGIVSRKNVRFAVCVIAASMAYCWCGLLWALRQSFIIGFACKYPQQIDWLSPIFFGIYFQKLKFNSIIDLMFSVSFQAILEMDLLLNQCQLHLEAKIGCSQNSSID